MLFTKQKQRNKGTKKQKENKKREKRKEERREQERDRETECEKGGGKKGWDTENKQKCPFWGKTGFFFESKQKKEI